MNLPKEEEVTGKVTGRKYLVTRLTFGEMNEIDTQATKIGNPLAPNLQFDRGLWQLLLIQHSIKEPKLSLDEIKALDLIEGYQLQEAVNRLNVLDSTAFLETPPSENPT